MVRRAILLHSIVQMETGILIDITENNPQAPMCTMTMKPHWQLEPDKMPGRSYVRTERTKITAWYEVGMTGRLSRLTEAALALFPKDCASSTGGRCSPTYLATLNVAAKV